MASSDTYNALLERDEPAVAHAASGPLFGLTFAVKDIFDVAGQRTGGGNPQKLDEAAPAAATAPSIQALLDAGARLVGRAQTDELTFSLMGHNAHYPQPVNPAAPDRVTGGSSSGSAAAVAGGLADVAIGSDTGGSVRAPASFCGLIGLRTTHGAIPLEGAMPLAPSFDTFGWFAKDIGTYEKVAEVLFGAPSPGRFAAILSPAGRGGRGVDAGASLPAAERVAAKRPAEGELRPLRLSALEDLLLGDDEASEYRRMLAVVAATVGEAAEAPALPLSIDALYWAFRNLQAHEAWRVHGDWIAAKDRGLGPGVKERFQYGSTIGTDVAREETGRRGLLRDWLDDLLGIDGILVLPTVPGAAPLRASAFDDLQAYRERALRMLCLSGLSGFPQITLPLGTVAGAPFGISLLGPAGSDLALVGLARRIMEGGS